MNKKDLSILPFTKIFVLSAVLILTFDNGLNYAFAMHFNEASLILLLVIPGILTSINFISISQRVPSEIEQIRLVWASLAIIIICAVLHIALRLGINILRGTYTLLEWLRLLSEGSVRGWIGIFTAFLFCLIGCYVFLTFLYGTFALKIAQKQNCRRGKGS